VSLNFKKYIRIHTTARGGAMTEYVMIVAILLGIFVAFGIFLKQTALFRGKRSAQSVNRTVPCFREVENSDPDSSLVQPKISAGEVLGYPKTAPAIPEECL
jgi:uncharacterized membrane protein YqiK